MNQKFVKIMNIGIIGVGFWGKNLIREYSKISNVVICCTKGNRKNTKWIKSKYPEIKHTTDAFEVINNRDIDAIVIASPISTHFKLALLSLRANKHVFVEKTLAENFCDAKRLLREAKNKNKILFVGHIFWYHEVLKKLKKMVKNDHIEKMILDWKRLGNFNEKLSLDLLSHFISILIILAGKPKMMKIESMGFITPCDVMSANGKLENGSEFFININRISNVKHRIIAIKTRTHTYLWYDDSLLKYDDIKREIKELYHPKKTALEIECGEFINSVMRRKKNYDNAEMALEVMQVLEKYGRKLG